MARSKYPDPDLENPEYQEQDEYRVRRSKRECTCNLLTPFGHVTCLFCNETDDDDWMRSLGVRRWL
jgi:hypothetical protein